jgi:hypothetical protein
MTKKKKKKIIFIGATSVFVGFIIFQTLTVVPEKIKCNPVNVSEIQRMKPFQLVPFYCEFKKISYPDDQCKVEQAKVERVLKQKSLAVYELKLLESCKI